MDEKQLTALLAAIIYSRSDKGNTLESAVQEAKDLWQLVNTGQRPPITRNPMRAVLG